MTIRIGDLERDLLMKHCSMLRSSPSEFINQLIREHIIKADPGYTEDEISAIAAKTGHTPGYVEKVLEKYRDNWKLQVQTLFRPSRARLSVAKGLQEFIDEKSPDYSELSVAIAQATGFRPTMIERILRHYPDNIELQVLELFKALSPRIEPDGSVTLKIQGGYSTYPLNSLSEFANLVRNDIQKLLPTEFDVARLTEMINDHELPSEQSFEEFYKKGTENEDDVF